MSDGPVLDTHAWIGWINQDPRLGASVIERLDTLPAGHRPRVCAVSLWDVAMLIGVPVWNWFTPEICQPPAAARNTLLVSLVLKKGISQTKLITAM